MVISTSKPFSLKIKTSLSLSEIEIIRALLDNEKIDSKNPTQSEKAKTAIQSILDQNGLEHIPSQSIYYQLQTIRTSSLSIKSYQPGTFLQDKTNAYPLHFAARNGDIAQVKKLVESGYKVNATDLFGSTPLHMAAMYGHKEVVDYLVKKGANVNATTYEEFLELPLGLKSHTFTPLDLAVKYAPETTTIDFLLQKGAKSDHFGILMETNFINLLKAIESPNFQQFDLALKKFETLGKGAVQGLWLSEGLEQLPLAVLLLDVASAVPTFEFYDRVHQTINALNAADKFSIAEYFITAKNLTHAFPSAHFYDIKIGPFKSDFQAEGFNLICPVKAACQSLHSFTKNLENIHLQQINSIEPHFKIKTSVFKQVSEIFDKASDWVSKGAIHEVSDQIYQAYHAGHTILLPTNWKDHAIDIILDKNTNLFILANGGDSYPALPSGLNAYTMQKALSSEDIYQILNSGQQMDLEFKLFYDLGLTPAKDFSILSAGQNFGNCAWFSQQLAEEGLLFLEINKAVNNTDVAKQLAHTWFEQLDSHHQTSILKTYLTQPSLEIAALADILLEYHNQLKTPDEKERAKLIIDTLINPSYKKEFDQYYKSHKSEFSVELNQFLKTNGYQLKSSGLGDVQEPHLIEIKEKHTQSEIKLKEVIQFEDPQDPLSKLGNAMVDPFHPAMTSEPIAIAPHFSASLSPFNIHPIEHHEPVIS